MLKPGRILKRLRFLLAYGAYCLGACAAVLLLVEGALRAFTGRPEGIFDVTPLNHTGLYHPNSRIPMVLLSIPYVVETNSLGFRGPEVSREKPAGTIRILALGDSYTDGYLVDNPDTYPVRLEEYFRRAGRTVDVVNAARGGSTIDREYWILRHYGAGLSPDVAVLAFVANDIYEMGNRSREQLIGYSPEPMAPVHAAAMLAARTATGEWLLDRYFRLCFPGYRGQNRPDSAPAGPERYAFPGRFDYAASLPKALSDLHSVKLHFPEIAPAVRERIDVYLAVLEDMARWCRERDIRLVFTWCPTFVQTYGETPDEAVYAYLLPRVAALGVAVIDPVPAFRGASRSDPLFLAPLDFHLSPAGNRLLAETIGAGLEGQGILPPLDGASEKPAGSIQPAS